MRLLIQPVVAQKGPIHGRDPRARLLAALGIALASVFIHHWMTGLLLLGLGLSLALLGGRLEALVKRLLVLEFVVLALLVSVPLQVPGEPLVQLAGLSLSREGLLLALLIFCKVNGVALALFGLLYNMEPMRLGQAMARLGAPDKLVHLLILTLNQTHLLQQAYQRLATAMRARGFAPGNNWHSWRSLAQLMGLLLVRALERSKRLDAAMRARGFQGRFYLLEQPGWRAADGLFLALLLGLGLGLLIVEQQL